MEGPGLIGTNVVAATVTHQTLVHITAGVVGLQFEAGMAFAHRCLTWTSETFGPIPIYCLQLHANRNSRKQSEKSYYLSHVTYAFGKK